MKKYANEIKKNNLTKLIEMFGYNRKEIAKKLGLKSEQAILRWEKGETLPDCITAIKLAVILKTNPESIYSNFRKRLIKELEDVEKSKKVSKAVSVSSGKK